MSEYDPSPDKKANYPEYSIFPAAGKASRSIEKIASRNKDRERIANGESPQKLQQENSIFPPGFFNGARISNLNAAVGR